MIGLFEHNQKAYESAVAMLSETGKAAIVHPTGTGKSFIGFKLCEDNPEKTICWLSPSEYIFKTQLENIRAICDYEPTNIRFITYAKLMLMSVDEIAEVQPDFIILDEFHRCGAEMWGQGVQNLLNAYKDVPVLGLSATAIRYLDNQRDMSDELFDGNIASEMTLGEAIVRGILNPPKYVLSMFCYQQSLEKYEIRARRSKSKPVRDVAERYLEELRRTLEKADGLDEIFAKHMDEPHGKYIVFCANKEHMDEMMSHMEWFKKVDKNPRVYSFYTNDPSTSEAFNDFKVDNDTNHLRLLYCIDALNEGIHVDDVSGVILLRPTVSPTIYKQQIGRALSASKKTHAVIFDIVLNIENLYSIGAIEDEIEIATVYYRDLGEGEQIVNERFNVIDEVRDCRVLFDKLNDTLTASWDLYYRHATEYYEENENLDVPARYITPDGYALGRWIFNQKGIRRGTIAGSLSEDQIEKLDMIGMQWDYYNDLNWERNFDAAREYYEKHHDLMVPARYVTDDGISLGSWICNLRTWEKADIHSQYLTPERREALNTIGMTWDVIDYLWEKNYMAAVEYYKAHCNLNMPSSYVDRNGVRLGSWICRMRSMHAGRHNGRGTPPTEEQVERLNRIGMVWVDRISNKWETGYQKAVEYVKQNGDLRVQNTFRTADDFQLGAWIQRQRLVCRKGTIKPERKERLDSIGMIWAGDTWEDRFALAKQYYLENGNIDISQKLVVNGVWLGKWIWMQKKAMDEGTLSSEQMKMLSELPMDQVGDKFKLWRKMYQYAAEFYRINGNLSVPTDYCCTNGCRLNDWIIRQRAANNKGELAQWQIDSLNSIGFVWTLESSWDKGLRYAKAYFDKNGDLDMPQRYTTDDGYRLGWWVFEYRKAHNGMKSAFSITDEQSAVLESMGMDWYPDKVWDQRFEQVKEYYNTHSALPKSSSKDDKVRKMGCWINNQRKFYQKGSLTSSKLKRLESIGITEAWLSPAKTPFEKGYAVATDYFIKHGNLDVATNYQHTNGFWLGSWLDKIRKKKDALTDEQIARLDAIGIIWIPTDNWEEKYAEAKTYYDKYETLPLEPKQCKTKAEQLLCQWLRRQLLRKNDGKMPQDQIDKLSSIGMDWLNSIERSWQKGIEHSKEYAKEFGNLNVIVSYVCQDGYALGEWLHAQRTHRKRLDPSKVAVLRSIGATGFDGSEVSSEA